MNDKHRKYYYRAMLILVGATGYLYGLTQGAEAADEGEGDK